MQARHAVIASIGDALRACQAAGVGFRGIGREPAVLPSSARAPEDAPTEGKCPPPKARRWAWMGRLVQDSSLPARGPAGRCLSYSPAPACLCSCLSAAVSERFDKA